MIYFGEEESLRILPPLLVQDLGNLVSNHAISFDRCPPNKIFPLEGVSFVIMSAFFTL
jgi:hypothetical protein